METFQDILQAWPAQRRIDAVRAATEEQVFSALQNIVPSHLADKKIYDFTGLSVGEDLVKMDGGDIVFDEPHFSSKSLIQLAGL